MSGIVGIVNTNGAPVDRQLLWRLTRSMSFRGPDAQDVWLNRNVGLGHTMFRTTFAATTEHQPATLDGSTWLTADARIDGREELLEKLSAAGTQIVPLKQNLSLNDAHLILYAYHTFGERCVDHLLGDFAFAIWDARNQQLFCARDHFGVKPFYYAQRGSEFIFSSSPNCLLTHPSISKQLNDQAIGDFLLFEMNLEPATSFFADIQRLPPAHTLKLSTIGPTVSRYWSLPAEEPLRYRQRQDYVDHFQSVMQAAVKDRLPSDTAALLLSGGMDSSSVAATARGITSARDLRAFTYVYDRLMPDRERYYAGLVASALEIPVSFTASDDYELYQSPAQTTYQPFELIHEPLRALFCDFTQAISQHSRVALTGDGGDALLYPEDNFPRKVLSSLAFGSLLRDVAFSYQSYGRFPRMGFRSGLKRLGSSANGSQESYYPVWLDGSFERRCQLKERWHEQQEGASASDFIRRRSYESLSSVMWPVLFADYDPEVTGSPVEFRYPFFDIRVVNFLLAIPSSPWCFNKGLLRIATQGQLPEEIRKRLKTQIVEDPILVRVKQPKWQLSDYFQPVKGLADYITVGRVNKDDWLSRPDQIWMHARPLSLNCWLRRL